MTSKGTKTRTRVSRLDFFRLVATSICAIAGEFSGLFRGDAAAGRRFGSGRVLPAAARPAASRGFCRCSDGSAERAAAARVRSYSQNGAPSSAGAGPVPGRCSRIWFRPEGRAVSVGGSSQMISASAIPGSSSPASSATRPGSVNSTGPSSTHALPRLAPFDGDGRDGAAGSGNGLLGKTKTPSPHAGHRRAW